MTATQDQIDAVARAQQAVNDAVKAADDADAAEKISVDAAATARDTNSPDAEALAGAAGDAERKSEEARAQVEVARGALVDAERVVADANAEPAAPMEPAPEAAPVSEPVPEPAPPALLGQEGATADPPPPEVSLLEPANMPAEVANAFKAWCRREIALFAQGHSEATREVHNP